MSYSGIFNHLVLQMFVVALWLGQEKNQCVITWQNVKYTESISKCCYMSPMAERAYMGVCAHMYVLTRYELTQFYVVHTFGVVFGRLWDEHNLLWLLRVCFLPPILVEHIQMQFRFISTLYTVNFGHIYVMHKCTCMCSLCITATHNYIWHICTCMYMVLDYYIDFVLIFCYCCVVVQMYLSTIAHSTNSTEPF